MSIDSQLPPADGTIETRDGRRVLRFERRLDHPVEKVWSALTEAEELRRWLAESEIEPVVGGRAKLRWLNTDTEGNAAVSDGTVRRFEPPRLLEYDSVIHGLLRWELSEQGDGCLLVFTAQPLGPDDQVATSAAGWHIHLDHFAEALAGRPGALADVGGGPHVALDRLPRPLRRRPAAPGADGQLERPRRAGHSRSLRARREHGRLRRPHGRRPRGDRGPPRRGLLKPPHRPLRGQGPRGASAGANVALLRAVAGMVPPESRTSTPRSTPSRAWSPYGRGRSGGSRSFRRPPRHSTGAPSSSSSSPTSCGWCSVRARRRRRRLPAPSGPPVRTPPRPIVSRRWPSS